MRVEMLQVGEDGNVQLADLAWEPDGKAQRAVLAGGYFLLVEAGNCGRRWGWEVCYAGPSNVLRGGISGSETAAKADGGKAALDLLMGKMSDCIGCLEKLFGAAHIAAILHVDPDSDGGPVQNTAPTAPVDPANAPN